jgi:AcrR family transcriptional regulator
LLDAAAALFGASSVPAVSIADITREAGVAVGTFYRFFPTKESVLHGLRAAALDELQRRASAVANDHIQDDWWIAADAMTAEMIRFWFEDPARARVVLSAEFEELADVEAELLRLFAAGIRVGQQRGAVGDVDPDFAASFILHAAHGLIYHELLDGDGRDPSLLIDRVQQATRRLLDTSEQWAADESRRQ